MTTWTQVASLDAPSAGVFDFTGLSLSSYAGLHIVGAGITVTTDDSNVVVQFYISGVLQSSTTYKYALQSMGHIAGSAGSATTADGATATGVLLNRLTATWKVGNAAGEHMNFVMDVDQPTGSVHKRVGFVSAWMASAAPANEVFAVGSGILTNTGTIDGIKVIGGSNLTAGHVRVLGLA